MSKNKRQPIVAGNWKMNGSTSLANEFEQGLTQVEGVTTVICPPALYISAFTQPNFALGGQDVSHCYDGAHTGDTSVRMLSEAGCQYVIVGHSERRDDHGESNTLVAEKAKKALSAGLIPIICVGESLQTREAGEVNSFIDAQLNALTDVLSVEELSKSVIAYEPIWAIGTGVTATPEQAQEVHEFIRQRLNDVDSALAEGMRILYGGSVKPDNAKALFGQADVDGGLIGGASLKMEDFKIICQAAG